MVGMNNFQDTFKTVKRSFIIAFSICMIVPLIMICIITTLEATPGGVLLKKLSLKNSQYPQERICIEVSFLMKLKALEVAGLRQAGKFL